MKKAYNNAILLFLILIGAGFRVYYVVDLPLSGDEAVSLLQASGHSLVYKENLKKYDQINNLKKTDVMKYISYSEDYSLKNVVSSLRYAGMHPPLYYFGLHYVLKYINNKTITMRLVSVIFSIASILCIYLLGKSIFNDSIGLLSALFLAISAYGVKYAAMVRPYPLIMLISIISTFQVYNLCENRKLMLNYRQILLYVFTVLIGFLTIYNFVYVFVFQVAFLSLYTVRDKTSILRIISICFLVFVSFLMWLPAFIDQFRLVRDGEFYFHGKNSIFSFVESILYINYLKYFPAGPRSLIKYLLAATLFSVILAGCIYSCKDTKRRFFILALIIYVIIHFIGDKLLNSSTLSIAKMLFFVMPISNIIMAAGIYCLSKRFYIRNIGAIFCFILLLNSSIAICNSKKNYDGPGYIISFSNVINETIDKNEKSLVLTNTFRGRYFLSLVHAIEDPVNLRIIFADNIKSKLQETNQIKTYDYVFIVNCDTKFIRQKPYSQKDLELITNVFSDCSLSLINTIDYEYDDSLLMVFKKDDTVIK